MEYRFIEQVLNEDAMMNSPADGIRKYPVDTLVAHYTATKPLANMSASQAIDTISAYHKDKFYREKDAKGNWTGRYIDPHHEHRLRAEPVYCAYHILIWPVDGDWKFVPTMKGIMANVAGGTSIYRENAHSLQVCVYADAAFEPDTLFVVRFVDFFRGFRFYVEENFGKPLAIIGHRDIEPTECPGKIYGLLGQINNMIGRNIA